MSFLRVVCLAVITTACSEPGTLVADDPICARTVSLAPGPSDTPRAYCASANRLTADRWAACSGGSARDWLDSHGGQAEVDATCEAFAERVRQGHLTFDASAAAACLGELAANGCAPRPAKSCTEVVEEVPTKGLGEDCSGGAVCADGLYCNDLAEQFGGTCPPMCEAQAREGEPCNFLHGQGCVDGLICHDPPGPDSSPSCRRYLQAGEACLPVDLCGAGTFCNAEAICETKGGLGESCASDAGCELGLSCKHRDGVRQCVPAKESCVIRIGDACVVGRRQCPLFSHCSSEGICTVDARIGEACGALGGELAGCLDGYCSSEAAAGTCLPRREPGADCETSAECGDLRCVESTCVRRHCE